MTTHLDFLTILQYGDGILTLKLRFTACVMYYSSGSFRDFESVQYTNLNILDTVTAMELVSAQASAWSHTGSFPCTRLDYAYTANVRTVGNVSASVGNILGSAGFSKNVYYYKLVNSDGYFDLYN